MSSKFWDFNLSKCNVGTLEDLVNNTDYQIVQNNGQRIYSPSATARISPPPKGTEIFIGNLPPDLYENEIIPLFSTTGPIYNLRLMVDFYGRNRGYAFISYFCTEHAHAAVIAFNKFKLRRKTKLAVSMSVDNRRLFIGNIPRHMNLDQIESYLEKFVEGMVQVILYREPYNENLNRGFVFVEFETHRLAAIARRQLSPGNLVIWDKAIFVDWAEPLPVVDPKIMENVTKLYLSNIPAYVSSERLKDIVLDLVQTQHLVKVHKMSTFAFVHFNERSAAEGAFKRLLGLRIGENVIGVEWARPIEFSKNHRVNQTPQNFCRSVPPSMRKLVQEELEKKGRPKRRPLHSSGTDGSGSANGTTTTDLSDIMKRMY